ncbi:hypothetical protein ACIRQP_40750 [Streptomyces sp. NPDC102274]|uniref:hypothetical protein n=1 Tax=Streptomyces sp. NPDC102274 TaxID=3366151 RepID=UPI003825E59D
MITAGHKHDSPQFQSVLERIRVPRTRPGRPRAKPGEARPDKGDYEQRHAVECGSTG